MAEDDTVKLEIELPKDQIHIIADGSETPEKPKSKRKTISPYEQHLEKFKRQVIAASKDVRRTPQNKTTSTVLPDALEQITSKNPTPPNPNQKRLIAIGLAVAVAGLLLWPLANFWLAIAVALIGSAVVATGAFVKV